MWGVGGNVFKNVKNLTSSLSNVAANLLDPDAEGPEAASPQYSDASAESHRHGKEPHSAESISNEHPAGNNRGGMPGGDLNTQRHGGNMHGLATTSYGVLSSATSMFSKVATHVAGVGPSDTAEPASSRARSQVDTLKAQVIACSTENDALQAQVAQLGRQLEEQLGLVEQLQAAGSNALHLRQELIEQQKARQAAEGRVAALKTQLSQVSDGRDSVVAERDSFWIKQVDEQRNELGHLQLHMQQLQLQLQQAEVQLQQQGQQKAAGSPGPDPSAVSALPARLPELEQLLDSRQARVAALELEAAHAASEAYNLRAKQEELQGVVSGRTAELERAQTRVRDAEREAGRTLRDAEQEAAALKRDVQQQEQQNSQLLQQLEQLRASLADAQGASAAVSCNEGDDGERVGSLEAELLRLRGEAASVLADLEAERAEREALQGQLDAVNGQDEGGIREQLAMLRELFEEEREYSLSSKEELRKEQGVRAAADTRVGVLEAQLHALQAQMEQMQQEGQGQQQAVAGPLSGGRDDTAAPEDRLLDLRVLQARILEQQEELQALRAAASAAAAEVQVLREERPAVASALESASVQLVQEAGAREMQLLADAALAREGVERRHREHADALRHQAEAQLCERDERIAVLDAERGEALLAAEALEAEAGELRRQLAAVENLHRAEAARGLELAASLEAAKAELSASLMERSGGREAEAERAAVRLDQEQSASAQLSGQVRELAAQLAALQRELRECENARDEALQRAADSGVDAGSAERRAEALAGELEAERGRWEAATMQRDAFWKQEVAARASVVSDVEMRQRQAQELMHQEQQRCLLLQSEAARAREELEAAREELSAGFQSSLVMQRELEHTQAALERAQAAAAAGGDDVDLEREAAGLRSEASRLSAELRRSAGRVSELEAQLSAAVAATAVAESQREVAEGLARSLAERLAVAEAVSSPSPNTAAAAAEAEDVRQRLSAEVADLSEALDGSEREREKLRAQLVRLKEQMMREQEDEEDKIEVRLESEVQRLQAAADAQQQRSHAALEQLQHRHAGELRSLRDEAAAARTALLRAQEAAAGWEEALAAKEHETANLQAALGEMSYESDAAERLRLEVKAVTARSQRMQGELAEAGRRLQEAEAAQGQAEAAAAAARAEAQHRRVSELRTGEECGMLRCALDQALAQMQALSSESSSNVDRRIVAKLLVTYFEKGNCKEVLRLLASMLALSDDDKRKVGLMGVGRRGILRTVAGMPISLVQGAGRMLVTGSSSATPPARSATAAGGPTGSNSDNLADQWVRFLMSQAERDLEQQQQQQQQQLALGQGAAAASACSEAGPAPQAGPVSQVRPAWAAASAASEGGPAPQTGPVSQAGPVSQVRPAWTAASAASDRGPAFQGGPASQGGPVWAIGSNGSNAPSRPSAAHTHPLPNASEALPGFSAAPAAGISAASAAGRGLGNNSGAGIYGGGLPYSSSRGQVDAGAPTYGHALSSGHAAGAPGYGHAVRAPSFGPQPEVPAAVSSTFNSWRPGANESATSPGSMNTVSAGSSSGQYPDPQHISPSGARDGSRLAFGQFPATGGAGAGGGLNATGGPGQLSQHPGFMSSPAAESNGGAAQAWQVAPAAAGHGASVGMPAIKPGLPYQHAGTQQQQQRPLSNGSWPNVQQSSYPARTTPSFLS